MLKVGIQHEFLSSLDMVCPLLFMTFGSVVLGGPFLLQRVDDLISYLNRNLSQWTFRSVFVDLYYTFSMLALTLLYHRFPSPT